MRTTLKPPAGDGRDKPGPVELDEPQAARTVATIAAPSAGMSLELGITALLGVGREVTSPATGGTVVQ
jgi:hypothetical protein